MSQPSRIREGAYTVGFTVAVTAVFISAVSALQVLTRERVAQNATLYLQRAVMEAAGAGRDAAAADVRSWYAASVEEFRGQDGPPVYRVRDSAGGILAHVFRVQGTGLWGSITAAVGLSGDLDRITGVAFIDHNETPGLGARIEEDWFKRQFVGHKGPFSIAATPGPGEERMDAITGATITSRGVRDMLNTLRAGAPAWVRAAKKPDSKGTPGEGGGR